MSEMRSINGDHGGTYIKPTRWQDGALAEEHMRVPVRIRDAEVSRGILIRIFDAHGRDRYLTSPTLDALAAYANGLVPSRQVGDVADLAGTQTHPSGRRAFDLAAALVVGCVAELEGGPVARERHTTGRGTSNTAPSAGIWKMIRPVRADVREACLAYCVGGGKSPSVRTFVAGHYKWQPHGPEGALRKRIHIEPYWRGPEAGAIARRPHLVGRPKKTGTG